VIKTPLGANFHIGRGSVPRKTTKKTTRKKSPARPKAGTGKPSKSTTAKAAGRSRSPLYVLVIMGLVTAIFLMLNRYYTRQEPQKEQAHSETERATMQDKKEAKELLEGKKSRADKPEKAEKSEPQEKEQQARAPVRDEVKIYFVKFNEKSEKMLLTPVTRRVDREQPLENTIRELIKGPTAAEKKKGLLTAVPSNLKVNGIRLKNGTAEMDFNGAIEQGASGSVLINRIDQIVYTATQFPQVKSIVIKINGRSRQTLGTDGLSIGGPLHRRQ
jgi:spore germination protein GerM